ncbi:hypothetical protein OC834_000373 [Tilletia horrida]|nr:hypothetical protein OC834_000373 [Tilletia horrida]
MFTKTLVSVALLASSALAFTEGSIRLTNKARLAARASGSGSGSASGSGSGLPGCDVDGVWCLVVQGDRNNYVFGEKTYTKETALPDGRHIFYYSAGKTDSLTLKNGDTGFTFIFSEIVSISSALPWSKGPKAYSSFTAIDSNENSQNNANGWVGEHSVFSTFTASDDLYVVIPKA